MKTRSHGKYTYVRFDDIEPVGRCDYSGLLCARNQMVKQMEYSATGLIWTGKLVNPKFADVPNGHKLIPPIKIDPQPVYMPRPGKLIDEPQQNQNSIDVTGNTVITLTLDSYNYLSFYFYGEMAANTKIIVPALFNEFYVTNSTVGEFLLSMEVVNNSASNIELPRLDTVFIVNNGFTLNYVTAN